MRNVRNADRLFKGNTIPLGKTAIENTRHKSWRAISLDVVRRPDLRQTPPALIREGRFVRLDVSRIDAMAYVRCIFLCAAHRLRAPGNAAFHEPQSKDFRQFQICESDIS
jgi:hypothetical protein